MQVRLTYGRAAVVVVLLAAALRIAGLSGVEVRTPDENVYTQRSADWLASGPAGIRPALEAFAKDWLMPPPDRVGLFQLTAWTMWLTGRRDPLAGAILSCVSSIGSMLLLSLICYRFIPPAAGLCSLLLYAVSPLELDVARRAWVDAPLELAVLAATYLACEIARGRRGWFWIAGFAMAGAVGLAIKESMPLPFGICLIWVVWELWRRGDRSTAARTVAAAAAGTVAAVAWMVWATGGLWFRVAAAVPSITGQADYTVNCCVGSPHMLPQALWSLTPVTLLLTAAGIYAIVRPDREDADAMRSIRTARWIAVVGGAQMLFTMLTWMNLRYIVPALGPLYLAAGYGFGYLLALARRAFPGLRVRRAFESAAAAVVLTIALSEYARFERIFVRNGLPDPTARALIDVAPRLP